jgi:hypothetical protein
MREGCRGLESARAGQDDPAAHTRYQWGLPVPVIQSLDGSRVRTCGPTTSLSMYITGPGSNREPRLASAMTCAESHTSRAGCDSGAA